MEGKRERFDALFSRFYAAVQAYVRRRCDPDDVDDVVAEAFTVAWRRLEDIPDGRELPWLYGVARRCAANQRRGVARRVALLLRVAHEAPVRSHPSGGTDPRVVSALRRLRPADQEVLRLAAWEGLSPAEISVALNCSENAAALRLSRARKRLREQLTETLETRTQSNRKAE